MPNPTFSTVDINKAASEINAALNEVNDALRDAAYIAVGFAVLGFQKLQVRRVELSKQVESQLQAFNGLSAALTAQADEVGKVARAQTESLRSQLGDQLGELTKTIEGQLTEIAKIIEGQLGEITKTIDEQFGSIRDEAVEFAKSFDERVQPVRNQVDEQLDRLGETLPPGARVLVQSLRSAASAREQLFRGVSGLN